MSKPGTSNVLLWQDLSTGWPTLMAVHGPGEVGQETLAVGVLDAWELLGSGDFDGDGYGDLLWHHRPSHAVSVWRLHGTTMLATPPAIGFAPLREDGERAQPLFADMDQNGRTDIVWIGDRQRRSCRGGLFGETSTPRYGWEAWYMDTAVSDTPTIERNTLCGGPLLTVGQFDGEGPLDLLVGTSTQLLGDATVLMGTEYRMADGERRRGSMLRSSSAVRGVGDFDANGHSDVVVHDRSSGQVSIWSLTEAAVFSHAIGRVPDAAWQIAAVGDFNHDGASDLAWRNEPAGLASIWTIDKRFQVTHDGAPGISVGQRLRPVGTVETRKPYGRLVLTAWRYAPNFSAGATCPEIDLSLEDAEGVTRTWTGFDLGPYPARGSQVCDGVLHLTGLAGTYTLRTSAGATTSVTIPAHGVAELEVCSNPTACTLAARPPPPPPPNLAFSDQTSLTVWGGLPGPIGTNVPVWYAGRFPVIGSGTGRIDTVGPTFADALNFPYELKSENCGKPGSFVTVRRGEFLTPSQAERVFGAKTLRYPAVLVACLAVGPQGIPSQVPQQVQLTVRGERAAN